MIFVAIAVVLFSSVFCFYAGYRVGVKASAKHFARRFAKGMRQWLIQDFRENGKLAASLPEDI